MSPASRKAVLFVDDEANILNALKRLLVDEEYTVFTANSAEEGLHILEKHPIQLVISDQRMPGLTGVEFLKKIMAKYPHIIRIILSGYADVKVVLDPIVKGELYRFLAKPWNDEVIKLSIQQGLSQYDLLQLNNNLDMKVQERTHELMHLKELLQLSIEGARQGLWEWTVGTKEIYRKKTGSIYWVIRLKKPALIVVFGKQESIRKIVGG